MADTTQRDIVAGPSREELFDALRLGNKGRMVSFTINPAHVPRIGKYGQKFEIQSMTFEVSIESIGIEDGSGQSWVLKLYDQFSNLGSNYLEAYFHTTRRKGWMRPIEN